MTRAAIYFLAASLLMPGAAHGQETTQALRSIEAVKRLSVAVAGAEERPVRLEGVVTFVNVSGAFYLQDDTAGVFVVGLQPERAPHRGQRIAVAGVTRLGTYTPSIRAQSFKVLGEVPLPAPVPLARLDLASTRWHGSRVELEGVVRRSTTLGEHRHGLRLALGAERLSVELHDGAHPEMTSLVGARVRVRGSIGGVFNASLQWFGTILYLQGIADLEVLQHPPADPFALRERPLDSLLQFAFDEPPDLLVKVRGTVTARRGEEFFLSDGARGLRVLCQSAGSVQVADEVEAAGFPARGAYSPVLEDALVRVMRSGSPLAPVKATARDILDGQHDASLVTLTTELAGVGRESGAEILTLREGEVFFTAVLPQRESGTRPAWPEGSQLRLTGVAAIQQARATGSKLQPESFRLLLRTPADVAVLRAPPWWTTARLLGALAAAGALVLGALAWAATLRHRVRRQTAQISDHIRRAATLEERARLAREFHDTLEQELSGVALHLETAEAQLQTSPDTAARTLDTARRLARHCQDEASRAVWDMRAAALEKSDLPTALRETMTHALGTNGPALAFTVQGEAHRLPARLEHALVRIAQEAATNIARHAKAARVEVALHFTEERIALAIRDDGGGFTPSQSAGAVHFGLLGMRERVEHLGGSFQLTSQPGEGTSITVSVPLLENPPAA